MVGLDVDDVDESFVIIVIILGAIDVANIVSTGFVLMSYELSGGDIRRGWAALPPKIVDGRRTNTVVGCG